MKTLRQDSLITSSDEVVACELDEGRALLDLKDSKYYKLNGSAALIWEWLADGATLDSLVENMLEHFDVSESQCREDVMTIVTAFYGAGLVQQSDS